MKLFGYVLLVVLACIAACKKKEKLLFTPLSSSETGIHFINRQVERHDLNILYYLNYYNGGGVAIGDINNDGLNDLYLSGNSPKANKLYLNKGNMKFEDITASANVAGIAEWSTGVVMADVNADGLLDIYVGAASKFFNLKGSNALYINQGNLTFKEESAAWGLNFSGLTTQAAFFDYDKDGDLDCYILNQSTRPNANLTHSKLRSIPDTVNGDRLMRNELAQGKAMFTDVTATAGIYSSVLGYGLGISVADFNCDGWDDLYIGNDFHENDYYYLNQHDGTFKEQGAKAFGHFSRFSMGNDAADINNDGKTDIITVDMLPPDEKTVKTYGSDESLNSYMSKIVANGYNHQVSRNCIQLNLGGGSFADVALMSDAYASDWSWSPLFADFNNDGNKDLFISSGIVKRVVDLDYVQFVSALSAQQGMDQTNTYDQQAIDKMPGGEVRPFIYEGDGTGKFSDRAEAWGINELGKGFYNGSAYADLDNDGDLDIVCNSIGKTASLLQNNSIAANTIKINWRGAGKNTFGLGAKLYVFSKGNLQFFQNHVNRGFISATAPQCIVAVKDVADSLLVVWPSGKQEVKRNIKTKTAITFYEDSAVETTRSLPAIDTLNNSLQIQAIAGWKHTENAFLDFNHQYLIPQMQSNRGPALAVADVNNDGREDFFAGGAEGQQSTIYLQQANGSFAPSLQPAFSKVVAADVADACFADFNGDGKIDLLTVSGGANHTDGNKDLHDHFYLNNGSGIFIEDSNAMPSIAVNKSCVIPLDADMDGDTDCIITGHVDARAYGYPQSIYLLLNNGKGKFTLDTNSTMFKDVGIITAATSADVDVDGRTDLIVVGEWMPVTLFLNYQSGWRKQELPASKGLWQSVTAADVNSDGVLDIVAGNWGLNSKRKAKPDAPLKLFVKDFDKNGRIEQLMTLSKKGEDYTFYAKDELERAIPELKKYYLTYSETAGKTVQYMMFNLFDGYAELQAQTLSSAVFFGAKGGAFNMHKLPDEQQRAPLLSTVFLPGKKGLITAGNFFGVLPYEGRYDASRISLTTFTTNGTAMESSIVLPAMKDEVRRLVPISIKKKTALLCSINNDSLRIITGLQ